MYDCLCFKVGRFKVVQCTRLPPLFFVLRPNVVRCATCCCCCRIPLGCEQSTYNLSTCTSTHTRTHTVVLSFPSSSSSFSLCAMHTLNKSPICRFVFRQNIVNPVVKSRLHNRHTRTHTQPHARTRAVHRSIVEVYRGLVSSI